VRKRKIFGINTLVVSGGGIEESWSEEEEDVRYL
jgi:hypothetical protein